MKNLYVSKDRNVQFVKETDIFYTVSTSREHLSDENTRTAANFGEIFARSKKGIACAGNETDSFSCARSIGNLSVRIFSWIQKRSLLLESRALLRSGNEDEKEKSWSKQTGEKETELSVILLQSSRFKVARYVELVFREKDDDTKFNSVK